MIQKVFVSIVVFHLQHTELWQKGEGVDRHSEQQVGSVDQIIKIAGHPSFEGIHHDVHLFLHHLHLCENVRGSRVCNGRTAHILLLWSTRGVTTFQPLSVPPLLLCCLCHTLKLRTPSPLQPVVLTLTQCNQRMMMGKILKRIQRAQLKKLKEKMRDYFIKNKRPQLEIL